MYASEVERQGEKSTEENNQLDNIGWNVSDTRRTLFYHYNSICYFKL
jgi:hypothetical protein